MRSKTKSNTKFMRVFAVSFFSLMVCLAPRSEARVDAIYIVPTVSSDLAFVAQFPTRTDQGFYGSPEAMGILRFALPEELTGLDAAFEIRRTADGTWKGEGTDGSAVTGTCGAESRKWFACTVQFEKLKFDFFAREMILGQRFGRGFEFDQRTLVARHFEGQPIGIIKIRTDHD